MESRKTESNDGFKTKNDSNNQGLSQMLAHSQTISKNIDVIVKNQGNLNRLYDY